MKCGPSSIFISQAAGLERQRVADVAVAADHGLGHQQRIHHRLLDRLDGGLEQPRDQRPILGGRRGHHSEHLGHLLALMQFLPRTYPDATW